MTFDDFLISKTEKLRKKSYHWKQKMLIIIENCKQFRQYNENAFESIRIVIDHCNLKTFFKNKVLNRKKTKWWKKLIDLNFFIEYRFEINNSVDNSFRQSDYFHEKNKSINNFIEAVIVSQNNFAKKSNSCVFHITVFVIQKLNNETQMLLERAQRQNVFFYISLSKESFKR